MWVITFLNFPQSKVKKKNVLVCQNSRKSTVVTKWLERQGAEEAKHELQGRMWGGVMTTDSGHDVVRIRKNTEKEELWRNLFFLPVCLLLVYTRKLEKAYHHYRCLLSPNF